MSKKSRKEVFHPEVERQLPVKPVVIPSMEELNRLMERMLANERRRARREFAAIVAGIAIIFVLILAGGVWFTHDLLQQLKAERQLSERSREDLLGLLYAGRLPESAAAANNKSSPGMTMPPGMTPAASGKAGPAPAMPVPAATTAPAVPMAPAVPAAPQAPAQLAAASPPEPAAPPGAFRKSIEVRARGDLALRLPIPPPQ